MTSKYRTHKQQKQGTVMLKVTIPKIVLMILTCVFCLHLSGITVADECWDRERGGPTFSGNSTYPPGWFPEFQYDPNNPDEIDRNNSVAIKVIGGFPPYTWQVSGNGFSIPSSTTVRTNTLSADSTACGAATITVTDNYGVPVTGYVRCTTGTWNKKETGYCCDLPGDCYYHSFGTCGVAREIVEENKKWVFPAADGYCAYGSGCDLSGVNWHLGSDGAACDSNNPAVHPPECLPQTCNEGACQSVMGTEIGCLFRQYDYYEWECP